jgi:hypothetical protein
MQQITLSSLLSINFCTIFADLHLPSAH